ncbi:MAG: prepilin-type N-terminal cleavage/methylation domain-containing protein [Desulfobacteraceae bacterium]|nr:prepilin-type N-terminal cleavage/methylation domain-containing protein [Desulfobacteraceae bacterium]
MLSLKNLKRDQAGFTLVEIAIVMVIIGLLIGGVLKGQAMIENAKVKRVVKQADELRAAVMTFYDKYGVYPGDNNLANVPPGSNGTGNGNGQIAGAEVFRAFLELSLAELISGTYDGTTTLPKHSFGGNVDVVWVNPPGNSTPPAHYIRYYNLPGEICQEIDLKNDDGDPVAGTIVSSSGVYTKGTTVPILYVKF